MSIEEQTPPQVLPGTGDLLIILDARNRIEEQLLRDWVGAAQAAVGGTRRIASLSLPLADERSAEDTEPLVRELAAAGAVTVVPARVSWRIPGFVQGQPLGLRQLLFGDPRAPGTLRARWILWRDKTRAQCIAGAPATVEALRERYLERGGDPGSAEGLARFILRQAGLALDIAERGVLGSRYKVPRHVTESLNADARFQQALRELADESGQPLATLAQEAEAYMGEMVARPNPFFIDLKARLERKMLSLGYARTISVAPGEIERFRQMLRNHPTLVLFTHKSYLDGLAATDIAYRNDMPLIHTFGGVNMAMPGLSTMMRGAGGIFIRRSFRDNALYKLVLRFYISYLLEKRFPMTWAFEGTRSRLGKLMPPRYGLMKYVIDAAASNDIRDLHFLPVATSFDLIRDVDDFVAEQAGRSKKPESLIWFMHYLRSLKEPRGKIYVNFGQPVIVEKAPDPEDRLALAKIAFEVAVQANRVTPFTLGALICFILLGSLPRGMTATELQRSIAYFVEWARERGIRLSDPLASDDPGERERMMGTLLGSGLFLRYDQASQTVFSIEPAKHAAASYYRNTIVHHFLERAIIDLALLKAREQFKLPAGEVFWAEAIRLRELFKFEFFYPEKPAFLANLRAELGRVDSEWERRLEEGGVQLQGLINRCQPLVGHAVFLPLVEAYTVILLVLVGLQPGEEMAQKDCVEQALKEGRFALMMGRITSEASIAKVLFENGFRLAEHMGLAGVTDAAQIAGRKQLLREFRDLSRRMEASRLESLRLADKVFDEAD